jgi:hypothetical protein
MHHHIMSRTTAALAALLASLALPAAASARAVPMNAGKGAIVRRAHGLGKSVARKTGVSFEKAHVSGCEERGGAVYCEVEIDFSDVYCTVNASATYGGGRLEAQWTGKSTCKKYPPKPAPTVQAPASPPASNSGQVPLGVGKVAIQRSADDVGSNVADSSGVDFFGATLSDCRPLGGGTGGVFCMVEWDYSDMTCTDGAAAAYVNGSLLVDYNTPDDDCEPTYSSYSRRIAHGIGRGLVNRSDKIAPAMRRALSRLR